MNIFFSHLKMGGPKLPSMWGGWLLKDLDQTEDLVPLSSSWVFLYYLHLRTTWEVLLVTRCPSADGKQREEAPSLTNTPGHKDAKRPGRVVELQGSLWVKHYYKWEGMGRDGNKEVGRRQIIQGPGIGTSLDFITKARKSREWYEYVHFCKSEDPNNGFKIRFRREWLRLEQRK